MNVQFIVNFLNFEKGRMNRQLYLAGLCLLNFFERIFIKTYTLDIGHAVFYILASYFGALFVIRRFYDLDVGKSSYFYVFFTLNIVFYILTAYVYSHNISLDEAQMETLAKDIAETPMATLTLSVLGFGYLVLYVWLLFWPGVPFKNDYGPVPVNYIGRFLKIETGAAATKSAVPAARTMNEDEKLEKINDEKRAAERDALAKKLKGEI